MAIRRTVAGDDDPAGAQKDALERRMIGALVQFWREQAGRIRRAIEPVVPSDRKAAGLTDIWKMLDRAFWTAEERELLAVLLPAMLEGAAGGVDAHAAEIEALGLGVDWTLPHTEAAAWARKYSAELIKGITGTTKDKIRQLVGGWIETPGSTLGDLYSTFQSDYGFSERRARLIAITETTRAYAGGEIAAAAAIEDEGLFTYAKRWQTNNDELVCQICEPLNQKTTDGARGMFDSSVGQVDGPPAHPGCRCWVSFVPVIEGAT